MLIALEEVGFTYLPGTPMARRVLEGVDLSLREGEVVCLMGASGSGKTTLLGVASGMLSPTRGKVFLDTLRVDDSPAGRRRLRGAVGVLFQNPRRQLFAESVEKDVSFGPRNLGLRGHELAERAREAMRVAGLEPEEYSHRSPFSLSDGEMRRAALAGVLAMRPRFLLLDEPSSGLDASGRRRFRELISDLRRQGKGILLVTHDWEEVESLADRVVVLDGGKVAFTGTRERALADVEAVSRAGIAPPPLAELLSMLRRKGLSLSPGMTSPAEAASLIAEAMGGRGR